MKYHYFGTSLTELGHYFFELSMNSMSQSHMRFGDLPFYPEQLPVADDKSVGLKNGTVRFYKMGRWSICAIQGSPKDKRPGCHSVFFWEQPLTNDQMIAAMKQTPIICKIIEQMPFPVEIFKPE